MAFPRAIDASYADDSRRPGTKVHQQLHDAMQAGKFYASSYRTGSNTDAEALQAASNAAFAAGGGAVVAIGRWTLDDWVWFHEQVVLIGGGSSQNGGVTEFFCTTAESGLRFGDQSVNHTAGVSGGFYVDGGVDEDDNPIAIQPFYVGCAVGRSFFNIDIHNSAQDLFTLQGTANCYFEQVNVQHAGRDAFHLDRSFGNTFVRCEAGVSGRFNLALVADADTVPNGGPANYSMLNNFYGCFFEYTTATSEAIVYQGAGINNTLSDCIVVATVIPAGGISLVKVEKAGTPISTTLKLRDCTVQATSTTGTTGIEIVGTEPSIHGTGTNTIFLCGTGIKRLATGGSVSLGTFQMASVTDHINVTAGQEHLLRVTTIDGPDIWNSTDADNITARADTANEVEIGYSFTLGVPSIRFGPAGPQLWAAAGIMQTHDEVILAKGEAGQVSVFNDKMYFGTATDTDLYRAAADTLATDDDFEVAAIGKGVVLKSPNGARWRIAVGNDGALTATAL